MRAKIGALAGARWHAVTLCVSECTVTDGMRLHPCCST